MLIGDFCFRNTEGQEQMIYMMLMCQYLLRDFVARFNFSPKFLALVLCDYFCLLVTSLRKSVHCVIEGK